jgi:hypothetical protein
MICTNCGKEVPDSAKVCGYCGHLLKAIPAVQVITNPAVLPLTQVSQKRHFPIWVWIAAPLILLVIIVGVVLMLPPRVPSTSDVIATVPVLAQPAKTEIPPTSEPLKPAPILSVEPFNANTDGNIPKLKDLLNGQELISFKSEQPVMVSYGWCTATKEILDQNFESMEIAFYFDGQKLPIENFSLIDDVISGGICRTYKGVVRSWPSGQHEIKYLMTTNAVINDGEKDYPPGEIGSKTFPIVVSD